MKQLCHFVQMVKEEIANNGLHLDRDVRDTQGESGRCLEDGPGVVNSQSNTPGKGACRGCTRHCKEPSLTRAAEGGGVSMP